MVGALAHLPLGMAHQRGVDNGCGKQSVRCNAKGQMQR